MNRSKLDLVKKKILDFYMYLDRDDLGISKELLEHGMREKNSVDFIKKIPRADMNVLELGANIGFYALIEAPIVKHIFAIEPVKYNYNLLKKNVKLNKADNVSFYNIAIGATTGKGKIYTSKRCNWATITERKDRTDDYAQRWDKFDKGYQEVYIYRLDDFVSEYAIEDIDLIRMDVEGAEIDIISGGLETLAKMKQNSWLVIEIHSSCIRNKESVKNMLDNIEACGFKVAKAVSKFKDFNLDAIKDVKDFLTYKVGCPQVFFKK